MANVLYLTTDGLTDVLGKSQILPYLEGLARLNHTITIISLEKKERQHEFESLRKSLSINSIQWIPLVYHNKPSVLATVFDLYCIRKHAVNVCSQHDIDIVHTRSYLAGLVGLSLKRIFDIKLLFDTRGFWIDERIEGEIWNVRNPIYKMAIAYLRKKEIKLFKTADGVVVLTERAKVYLNSHESLKPETTLVNVIPCCADEQVFNPELITKDEIRRRKEELHLSPSDIVISYHGSLGTWYMMDELFDFFSFLIKQNPNAKLLLISRDETGSYLERWKKRGLRLEDLRITKATRSEVPLLLALSDLCVFFIKPVFSKIASSPTKMAEIIFMKRPFITNSGIGDVDRFAEAIGKNRIVKEFSSTEYERVIDLLSFSQRQSVDYTSLCEFYSLKRGTELYNSVYEQLIRQANPVTFANKG